MMIDKVGRVNLLSDSSSLEKLQEQATLASLRIDIGSALIKSGTLQELLQSCVDSMILRLNGALARIWTVDESENCLILQASAGLYKYIDGSFSRVNIGEYKVGKIAADRLPELTNDVQRDPNIMDVNWAIREGLVSFAGHPLTVGDKLVGVMAMFSRNQLTETTAEALASIAEHIALGIVNKVSERARAELISIVQSSQDAILGKTPDGIIRQWSESARELYGFSAFEVLGKHVSMLVPEERLPELEGIQSLINKGHQIKYLETIRKRKDGSLVDVSLSISPIRDSSGKIVGASTIARDITEQKRREEAEKLVMVMLEREDFMFTLTHDLKNPLIGANRILEQLANQEFGAIADEPAIVLRKLQDSNTALISLIQNIIEVYRYEKDTKTLVLEELDIGLLIEHCLSEFKHIANTRGIALAYNAEAGENLVVMADASSLRRVFINLIDNAVKFSPDGTVVRVKIQQQDRSVLITTHNFGECIPPEDLGFLFQRFWQGARGRRYVAGSGLGLYLCHKIITAHGGQIVCSSDNTVGTIFSVSLPLRDEASTSLH